MLQPKPGLYDMHPDSHREDRKNKRPFSNVHVGSLAGGSAVETFGYAKPIPRVAIHREYLHWLVDLDSRRLAL